MDARTLRDALSSFATGVTIVTTVENDGSESGLPVGMTASSFNSVSMEPPLVLWSVTKTSLSAETFKQAAFFAIHILASDQVKLSNQFATRGVDKFDGVHFKRDRNNIPLISGAVTRFDCKSWNVVEGGDHWIIIGEVIGLEKENREPLVFSGGSYATASPIRTNNSTPDSVSRDASPIDSMLLYNLSRAYRQMSQRFYHSVHDSGLSVPEWRILASLHSNAERDLADLAARTFIDAFVLIDMLEPIQESGLCEIVGTLSLDNSDLKIRGTDLGHERVEHLFKLAQNQEQLAVAGYSGGGAAQDHRATSHETSENEHAQKQKEKTLKTLVSLLQNIIDNTA